MTERINLADALSEPDDGTRLAVHDEQGRWWAIWRDDAKAAEDEIRKPGAHWFEGRTSFPLSWHAALEDVIEVFAIAEKPMAPAADTRACRHCGTELKAFNGHYYSQTKPRFFCDDERTKRHEPASAPGDDDGFEAWKRRVLEATPPKKFIEFPR